MCLCMWYVLARVWHSKAENLKKYRKKPKHNLKGLSPTRQTFNHQTLIEDYETIWHKRNSRTSIQLDLRITAECNSQSAVSNKTMTTDAADFFYLLYNEEQSEKSQMRMVSSCELLTIWNSSNWTLKTRAVCSYTKDANQFRISKQSNNDLP